jgi:uncharacterized membrane protein
MSMIDSIGSPQDSRSVDPSLVTWTHVIYALHAASLIVGLVGAVSVVGAFLFGVPSIVAVVLNYVRRSAETWTEDCTRHDPCVVGAHAEPRLSPPAALLPQSRL